MIINRLTLHNFGIYAGTNSFVFRNEKPVVLIGGMNGRGKTTFLNGVLLSLYGSNSFAYKESKHNSYGRYLSSFVNESDGSKECYVELEFKINATDKDVYVIKRSWNSKGLRTKEELEVKKNDTIDEYLSNNWLVFIENLLPSALSPYFFFDGDNIADLATETTDNQMKEAIKALLGITVLDQLETDLARVGRKRLKRRPEGDTEELNRLKKLKESNQQELERIDGEIQKSNDNLVELNKRIEEKQAYYITIGGNIIEQRQDLYNKRAELKTEIQHVQHEKIELVASEYPLVLADRLLYALLNQANHEHDAEELKRTAAKIKQLYQESHFNGSREVDDFVNYVQNISVDSSDEMMFGLSDSSLYQLEKLLTNDLLEKKQLAVQLLEKTESLQSEIDKLDAWLSVDIDEKEISKAFQEIKQLEQQRIEEQEVGNRLQRQRSEINGRFIRSASEFNRFVESYLLNLELGDESNRLQNYNQKAIQILQKYRVELQRRRVSELTNAITESFKLLANKQNLISRIEMDPNTLDFTYYNNQGEIVPKSILSEGEKQMMIISILWALAICSKRKLPIIIDTPLARLDSAHRKSLIKTYFPHAGEQTIVLSTDSEIIGEYYDILKEYVSDEYTLVYDDISKSTHIVEGYFGENK